jgi:hypothetical protein
MKLNHQNLLTEIWIERKPGISIDYAVAKKL